jgi:uroporphyrinogen-III decarboxylase
MGAERLKRDTDKAILLHGIGGLALGDVGNVAAPWLKHPRGVRDVASWYMIMKTRPDFVYRIFERQTEISLVNLKKIAGVVGNRITAVQVSGTDFGMQTGPLISPRTYRELFKPFHLQINQWIHANTSWKTLIHTCGSVWAFLPDFIEAGFDILNPVQCSAARLDPAELKQEYGRQIVFWGGGVDTQSTLPFGTPEQVRQQVIERIRILAPGGGFVFNTIHNIQPLVPVENILEMFAAVREYGSYPI